MCLLCGSFQESQTSDGGEGGCRNPAQTLRIVSNGSGGVLWSHSRGVVCFSDGYEQLKSRLEEVPNIPERCTKGHPLTPKNLYVDEREGRWRCRQCGRERGASLRARQRTAA